MEDLRHDDDPIIDTPSSAPESIPANDPANRVFHERLGAADNNFYDEDFLQSIDPEQNPHISDQLNDEDLQAEAEADYR